MLMARKSDMNNKCVIMIGTSLQTMGGIATVVQGYMDAGLFDKARIQYVVTHSDGPAVKKALQAICGYGRFVALAFREKIALIHVHTSSRASFWRKLPFFWLARMLHYPYVLHMHGSEFMEFYSNEVGRLGQRFIRNAFDKADVVLALSPEWKQNIASFSRNPNIRVLPNGVAVASVAPHRDRNPSQIQLLFLGRLGNRKGIYDLLAALSKIRQEIQEFVLIAAGDGEIDEVKSEASRLGLRDNVQVPGWIDPTRRQALLEGADIFVLPSHAEGLPMSLLEAMAAGLPVVCSTVGGIPLAVSDQQEGLLVEPGNIDGLGQALTRMIRDPELRAACGQQALERAKREFSVQTCVDRLLDLYESYGIAVRR